ncbi:TniB family NTP-binding protein [Hydrogenophaga sp. PAMC20947]|uniref:TniB family NTP-binding protein n=1 Tax=Hydrogenophaga sp. PAMC20947 TaxID=2565558 RepID=UPI00109DB684|nr:TniB family NTP-binding protein [Hydrogenophaga sp. PAMC20947]QCB47670.1 transposase [Hydrogenophaga sp. PAMC20947]
MATAEIYTQLKAFDEQYIPFPPFVAAMTAIEANLQMFRETGVATHMLVTGEAGTGKSSLCRWLAHQHPLRVLPERDVIELLITAIPPAASIGGIASTMLEALGDPYASTGSVAQRTHRVITLCKGCGVESLLFDEAQHLQDRGDTKTHYMVGDWLKHLIDELAVPTVLLGLPRVENVLQVNDQLRRRFSNRRRLAVGQSDTDSIESECLQLFLSLTSLIDTPVSSHPYSAQEMGVRLYYASDGRVAYIKKLLFVALRWALEQDLDAIDASMLERAFTAEIWWEGIGKLNPFHPDFDCRRLDRGGEPFQVASSLKRMRSR